MRSNDFFVKSNFRKWDELEGQANNGKNKASV